MAHFRGEVFGARSTTSRCSTKTQGLETVASSWQGAVRVDVWHDFNSGKDMVSVRLVPWFGRGITKKLYEGPIGGKK